ncbi:MULTISPECIES: LPS assembly lipoprotein LptE [unclassified Modicisalibacter]|uniref:LPS-assembly lipoprotein LptE n=1 Tax=unclassified Modicisalibacter TaxID=2679913 RepID=UPI001CCC15DF|nr:MULTISPECIES: LPS assembly lipoprotein LptE [unclassified Modicisalibacter]MBZ9556476.1 hypothetical protein [Modicisalibacter sp. R2A 31.J]MBZ9575055.1 hypothetical protein [Modicisalibacter sp. MOD 31.J]
MNRRTFLTRSLGGSLALLAAGSLAGCGFHLRGRDQVAMRLDRLTLAGPAAPLTDAVRQTLRRSGVDTVDDAPWRLNLDTERLVETPLTTNDAGSRDIELRLSVPFSVQRVQDDAYLLERQDLEVSSIYQTNASDLLVRGDRREAAIKDLRREAASRLLDRLQSLDPSS